jgi:hypothetical protein
VIVFKADRPVRGEAAIESPGFGRGFLTGFGQLGVGSVRVARVRKEEAFSLKTGPVNQGLSFHEQFCN